MSHVLSRLLSLVSRPHFLTGVAVLLAFAVSGATNDLEVARQALRDGFWALARTHAGTNACAEARQIVLESWAREGKWAEIPKTLADWGDPKGDMYLYFRALAFARTGDISAVQAVLSTGLPQDPVYGRLAARLLAELARKSEDPARVVALLTKVPKLASDDRILLADAQSRLGEAKAAEKLWREVLADTNASVRAVATAAAGVGDLLRLRTLAGDTSPAEVRDFARLRLGRILLAQDATFDEGAKMIRETMTKSPDAEGALDAARALAEARLRRSDWAGAAVAFSEILEIWPPAAREESVQEGLGWALLKQGRAEEALAAFRRAESCAKTDEEHALAAVKSGDALAALGRTDDSAAQYRDVLKRWPKTKVSAKLAETVRLRELEAKGRALYREFRFAEAQKAFAEVAAGDEMRRGRMELFQLLCQYGQGHDAEAETRARKLMESTDDARLRADLTLWLARAAYNGGRWRESVELFGRYAAAPLVVQADADAARVWAARAALAANDFDGAIALATKVVESKVETPARADAQIVQGEALIELARFDEAVLVFDRAASVRGISPTVRIAARISRADALYALGADNPARYEEALAAYRELNQSESVPEETRLVLAYKTGLALEKLRRKDEASDQYYAHVVLAYREARQAGRRLNDETRAVFARAAFRLADLCEANGQFLQAVKTLELVAGSDVPAADEARRRIERIQKKGFLQ